jgi:putative cell wall-binding protein
MFGLGGALSLSSAAGALPNVPAVSGTTPILSLDGSTVNEVNNIAPSTYAIPTGTTGAAADWGFTVNDNPGSTTSDVWLNGDQLVINVAAPTGSSAQNAALGSYVEFDAASGKAPIAAVVANGSSGATAPTFTTALTSDPADADGSGLTDELVITFTDSAAVTGLNNFTVLVLNVNYTVGAGTPQGVIETPGSYYCQDGSTTACTNPSAAKTPILVVPNAAVIDAFAGANAPPVSLAPNTVNGAISPITITEQGPDVVDSDSTVGDVSPASNGYICVAMVTPGAKFTGTPTISASGTAIVQGTVSIIGGFIQQPSVTFPPSLVLTGPVSTLVAQVLFNSVTTPSTFTFSNLTVDAPGTTGPVTVQVTIDNNAQCTNPTQVLLPGNPLFEAAPSGGGSGTAAQTADNQITIFQVQNGNGPTFNGRIEGSISEQTAVASLEYEYPTTETGGTCLPNNAHPHPHSTSFGSSVVLTVDGNDGFDSLSAAYLASYAHTGVLLTEGAGQATGSTTTVDQYTMNAIQQEGVTTVYIVGGTDAVSAADATELASTPSYQCGGTVERTNALGQPLDLQVQRIWGQTADDTASAVATWVNSGYVGQVNIAGAFGLYDDVLGATDSGTSQNNGLRTAILVTDLDSQDAESASALSYFNNLPLLLTPEGSLGTAAETALLDLGIQQVIEVGGTLVVSNAVNASLTSQGISVLRIAGQDGTDTSVQLAQFELNTNWTTNAQPEGLDWAFDQDGGDNCLVLPDGAPSNYPASVIADGDAVYSCTITVALARGDFFADGVTSSDVTGNQAYPIILTENPTTLGTYTTAFLAAGGSPVGIDPVASPIAPFVPYLGSVIGVILPFGGPLAIADSTLTAALAAISSGNP